MEDKILSLYAKGLSTRDISKTLEKIYGFGTSYEIISAVTDKVIPLIEEWQWVTYHLQRKCLLN